MDYSKKTLDKLNADPDFQKKVAEDEILNKAFYSQDISKSDELKELALLLGGTMQIGEKLFSPPSLWWLATLGILESPLITPKSKQVSISDIDLAMWLVATGMDGISMIDPGLEEQCFGYCESIGFKHEDAYRALTDYIDLSLNAFKMFPDNAGSDPDSVRIDTHWAVNLAAKASLVSGISVDKLLKEYPIPLVAHLCVTCAERDGHKGIGRRNKNQVVNDRLHQLMDIHIIEKGWDR